MLRRSILSEIYKKKKTDTFSVYHFLRELHRGGNGDIYRPRGGDNYVSALDNRHELKGHSGRVEWWQMPRTDFFG